MWEKWLHSENEAPLSERVKSYSWKTETIGARCHFKYFYYKKKARVLFYNGFGSKIRSKRFFSNQQAQIVQPLLPVEPRRMKNARGSLRLLSVFCPNFITTTLMNSVADKLPNLDTKLKKKVPFIKLAQCRSCERI